MRHHPRLCGTRGEHEAGTPAGPESVLHEVVAHRDFVTEAAQLNARVRDLVDEARRRADEAIKAGDAGELTISLRETLALLEAVAEELAKESRGGRDRVSPQPGVSSGR